MIAVDTQHLGKEIAEKAQAWQPKALAALAQLKDKTCQGAAWTGWYDWPKRGGFEQHKQVGAWQKNLLAPYDLVVVCGIGGSYAGTRAVAEALNHSLHPYLEAAGQKPPYKGIVYAGHNLSETALIELLQVLDERRPILNVISKSGTTTEPSVAFRILRKYWDERFGLDEAKHRIVLTTDAAKGSLRALGERRQYPCFAIPDDIGGRFSVLTAVGLVPLALAGYDTLELLEGADRFFTSLKEADGEHPAVRVAAVRRAAWEAGKLVDVLAVSDPKLAAFAEWWKQLFGESEGKHDKGLLPASMIYTTDLHSLGQYLQEGYSGLLETFLMVEDDSYQPFHPAIESRLRVPPSSEGDDGVGYLEGRYLSEINKAAVRGAMEAHASRGLPCLGLSFRRRDAYHLGYLLAFFETVCALSAALLDLDPYNQPGVEAYKRNLFRLMGKPGF